MKHLLKISASIFVSGFLLALVSAGSLFAAGDETGISDRIVRGTLTAEGGTAISFSTPEGKGIFVRSLDGTRFFELTPKVLDAQTVQLTVQEFSDRDRLVPLDRKALSLVLDGKTRGTDRLPFGIALTGITFGAKVPKEQPRAKGLGGIEEQAECCVPCGPWIVCCEPAPGWCCDLECIGGDTCSACTSLPQ